MSRKVSAIIATHNRKDLLERAIQSVLSQRDCTIQIIVVDDFSSDGTLQTLRRNYDTQALILSMARNGGYGAAVNLGFEHSDGDFIALLGDDDYWSDPYKIARQLDLMGVSEEIGVSGTWWTELAGSGIEEKKTPTAPTSRYRLVDRLLASGGLICGSTALIRRSAWTSVGGMDPEHPRGVDSDFFRRVGLAGYRVEVLEIFTTLVDVGHGLGRMTPTDSSRKKMQALVAQLSVLKKHSLTFPKYPKAFFLRMRSILKLLIQIVRPKSMASNS